MLRSCPKTRLQELIALIDNQEGKIEIMHREIRTGKFGEWSNNKEDAENRIKSIQDSLKPLIEEYNKLKNA